MILLQPVQQSLVIHLGFLARAAGHVQDIQLWCIFEDSVRLEHQSVVITDRSL